MSISVRGTSLALVLSLAAPAAADQQSDVSSTALAHGFQVIDANGYAEDTGAANRIVAGDMLRSLSQEIPAAVCHLHNEIDVEEAEYLLTHSLEMFDLAANALLHGNEEIGIIGGEERPKTIRELEELMVAWAPVHDAALSVLNDHGDAAAAAEVYASTDAMLERTYTLLSHLEGEYAGNASLLVSDVMYLEVVGRMAAMNQRLAYEACRVWSDGAEDKMVADLLESMSIYENSVAALINGMPALGILPPPTPEIAAKLTEINDHWGELHDILTHVASGDEISPQVRVQLYHELAVKLHAIEELEVLYQDNAKRIY